METNPEFQTLNPEQLRQYIADHKEHDYLLIDVRQPAEYEEAHIPGSQLIPLMDLQTKLFDLPSDKDLLFYCHVGGRSMMAADLAVEAEVTEKGVYHLDGGIMAWDGKMVADYPKVRLFPPDLTPHQSLKTAMDLEKGAFRFYAHLMEKYAGEPFAETFVQLSKAENAHARAIYAFWEKDEANPPAFDDLFNELEGDILEGGEHLADILDRLDGIEGRPCLRLMELALHIEYTAFDLYRVMAERAEDDAAKKAFLDIAQAEKSHMRLIAQAIARCEGA